MMSGGFITGLSGVGAADAAGSSVDPVKGVWNALLELSLREDVSIREVEMERAAAGGDDKGELPGFAAHLLPSLAHLFGSPASQVSLWPY